MKNLLPIGLVCLIVSCTKTSEKTVEPVLEAEKETCTFGIEIFNLAKREPLGEEATRKPRNNNGGGGTSGGGGTVTPPPPTSSSTVILLDFDGHVVSNTAWNTNGDIVCSPANMMTSEMALVLERVTNDYSPFNVTVTLDENVFNAAPINRRTRVVITESWEWYGQVGGVAYIGSMPSGMNAPAFVFASLLYYNSKYIGEAASHEAGHTLGLYHQAVYNGCTMVSSYHTGQGTGETSWAPIMGSAYAQTLSLWHRGPNSTSCSYIQDDVSTISAITGFRPDDYVNSITGAALLSTSASGLINSSNDVDYFSVNLGYGRTISLIPANTGANNSGSNTDLVLRVYNSQGSLVTEVNDPNVLHASTYLNAGNYYVSVGTAANSNADTYGMLGRYTISVN